jgi:hypothetical protein
MLDGVELDLDEQLDAMLIAAEPDDVADGVVGEANDEEADDDDEFEGDDSESEDEDDSDDGVLAGCSDATND